MQEPEAHAPGATIVPIAQRREPALWVHWCIAEKINIFTARGEPCSWCGARRPR